MELEPLTLILLLLFLTAEWSFTQLGLALILELKA